MGLSVTIYYNSMKQMGI